MYKGLQEIKTHSDNKFLPMTISDNTVWNYYTTHEIQPRLKFQPG